MKRILLVCPNSWDAVQLARSQPRWDSRYRVITHGQDAEDSPATFDALAFVDQAVAQFRGAGIDGVTSSSDYPGCIVAAAIAGELGLPGPQPRAVLRCSHKYYSRLAQREAVPEATPRFALIDPGRLERLDEPSLGLSFPLFVKPVKSWFSQHARRIDRPADLRAFATSPEIAFHLSGFVAPFNQLLARYAGFDRNGSYLLAEELLEGRQVTVEGFVSRGRVEVIGIVDSVMYPGTISFQRFDYPSSLDGAVQARMADIAARVMRHIGFDAGLFNVEMFYDPHTGRVSIVEINPRMCGQFADLMELVNGTNTYEILLALAAGDTPPSVRPGGAFQVAASFALRSFGDRRVVRVPDPERIEAVQRAFPVTVAKTFYRAGQQLSDEDQSDGYSYRYAVVNLAAADRPSLLANFAEVERQLGFEFADIP